MSLIFELWDMGTGNFLEAFASEADMLLAVRAYARIEGDAYLDDLSVRPVREVDGRREWLPEIEGPQLRLMAIAAARDSGGATLRVSLIEQQTDTVRGLNRPGSGESRSA